MERDVDINVRIYNMLQLQMKKDLVHDKIDWRPAIDLELKTNWCLSLQGQHGFRLDLDKARDLEGILREEAILIEREMQNTFPPAIIPTKATGLIRNIDGPMYTLQFLR